MIHCILCWVEHTHYQRSMNLEYLRMAQYVCDVSCRVGMMYCEHDVLQWHWHGRASTTMAVLWQCNGTARATPWQFHGSTMAGPWQCHGRAILQALSNTVRITIKDWLLLGWGGRTTSTFVLFSNRHLHVWGVALVLPCARFGVRSPFQVQLIEFRWTSINFN